MKNNLENILIIGSQGFIGKNLQKILAYKYNTLGCDIEISPETGISYIQITKIEEIQSILSKGNFQYCINCAGSANVSKSILSPLEDFELNTLLVFEILDAIRKCSPKCKFINVSSAAVYGNPTVLPIQISDQVSPISPYGYHKNYSELICREFNHIYKIGTCSLRIFSAFGNGQKKLLLWDLYHKLINEDIPLLFGTGVETRDYIHIEDIAQQISIVLQNAAFNGEAYNIANGQVLSVKEVVSLMKELLGIKKNVEFLGKNKNGDPIYWQADIISMIQWGYKQQVSFRDGLKSYIDWIKETI